MQVWPYWYRDVLSGIAAPDNDHTELFLNVWQTYEQSGAQNNPLNTTEPWPGATTFNSAGVKNYPTPSAGTGATVDTLENGSYPNILAALHSGNPFTYRNQQAVADQITVWGTPSFAAWYLKYGGTAQSGPLSTPAQANLPTNSMTRAWAQLMRTLAVDAPRQLREAKTARARIRRAVR